jgi:ketosteroid isomerase-like protein
MARLIRLTRCDVMRTLSTRATRATLTARATRGALVLTIMAILACCLAPCGWAQDPSPEQLRARAKEKDVKQEEIVNLEEETARALKANNGALFLRIYGDDFVGIMPSGQVLDKAGWIATIQDPSVKYSMFVASDIKVRMFEETAVVTCLWSSHGTQNGRTFSRQLRVTHVYVYGQRGWQAIAGQETLLPG